MNWKLFPLSACFALAACGAPVETLTVLPDREYEISTMPPGGLYGNWLALSPAPDRALDKEALARCPRGYRKVNVEQGNGMFWIDFIRWDILCESVKGS